MKFNMLILVIPSFFAFLFLCIHMVKTKGWNFFYWFIGSGLVFGFLRARIINYIQINLNHSFIPYEFSGKILRIGNDSLVVYLGWIIVAYLSWQLAEIIIEKVKKEKARQILPIISLAFFIIAALSYANETAASVAGWWKWNDFLVSNFSNGIFVNVPWVGIVDWATVSFEYLAVFLLSRTAIKTKKWRYLAVLLLPIVHWISHIGTFQFNVFNYVITPSMMVHLMLPLIALVFWFFPHPETDLKSDGKENQYLWLATGIILLVCAFADLYFGKNVLLLVSIIPIIIFIGLALRKSNFRKLFSYGILLILLGLILLKTLDVKRLTFSLFPILYFGVIALMEKAIVKSKKINRKVVYMFFSVILLIFTLILLQSNLGSNSRQTSPKPSDQVILITLDTVTANHLSTYGYSRQTMPNLDKFAKENALFKNAYTTIPYNRCILVNAGFF